tara:strand:- start:1498 stop:2031 length:534 start_codon:yes stop_codon:yes gene_type:complete
MMRDPPIGFIVNVVYETMARLGVSPPEMKCEETWESIILPDGYTKPTKEVFEAKFQEIIREYSFKELRQERNQRLAEVDWIFSEDYAIDDASYQQWLTYRKALRDLPAVTEDPANPVWPEKPAMPSGTTETKDYTRELQIENNRLKNKVVILENRQTHFNTLLVDVIGRIEKLERPT